MKSHAISIFSNLARIGRESIFTTISWYTNYSWA